MFDRQSLQSDEFSWQKSLSLAIASQVAYRESAAGVIEIATGTWGFDDCQFVDQQDTQGFVAWDNQVVVISFRGTESFGDWLGNLELAATTRSYGEVHQGFYRAFDVVRSRLEAILNQASVAGQRLWLTGHSLGGAVATVAAAEWVQWTSVTGIYTFGQPKTVDQQAKQFIDAQYAGKFNRFVNDDDIVPKVPPGYTHVGQLTWFDSDGNLQRFEGDAEFSAGLAVDMADLREPTEYDVAEFAELQRQLRGSNELAESTDESAMIADSFFPFFSDHAIAQYIQQIRKQLESEA